MIREAISYYGTLDLTVTHDNMGSEKYCEPLEDHSVLYAAQTLEEIWTFQLDCASVHRSAYTTECFQKQEIDVLAWIAKSADLKTIENVWGLMTRRVYENGRQFTNKIELAQVIAELWRSVTEQYLRNLYYSISDRRVDVCALHVESTKY